MNEETQAVQSFEFARPPAPRLVPVRAAETPGGEAMPGTPKRASTAGQRSGPRPRQPDRETVLRLIEGIKVL